MNTEFGQKATIIYGVSGSGKTYESIQWANLYNHGIKWVSLIERDEIRFYELNLGDWKTYKINPVTEYMIDVYWKYYILRAIENGWDIIISDTLCNIRDRRNLYELLKFHNYRVEFVRMETPLDVCIERDRSRGGMSVGEDVIRKQWDKLVKNLSHI